MIERIGFIHHKLSADPAIKRQQLVEFGVLPAEPEKTPQQRIEEKGYKKVESIEVVALIATPTSQGSNLKIGFVLLPNINDATYISSKDPNGLQQIGELIVENEKTHGEILKAFSQITRSTPRIKNDYPVEIYHCVEDRQTLLYFPEIHLAAELTPDEVETFDLDENKGHHAIQIIDKIIENSRTLTDQSRQ